MPFEQAAAADLCREVIGDVDADVRFRPRVDPHHVGRNLFPQAFFQLPGNRKQQDSFPELKFLSLRNPWPTREKTVIQSKLIY